MDIKYDEFATILGSPIPAEVYAAVRYVEAVIPAGYDVYSVGRTVVKNWGHDVEVVLHWPDQEFTMYVHVVVSFLDDVNVEDVTVRVDGEYEDKYVVKNAKRSADLDLKTGQMRWIGTPNLVKNLLDEAKEISTSN